MRAAPSVPEDADADAPRGEERPAEPAGAARRAWSEFPVAIPSPSERELVPGATGLVASGLAVLRDHAAVLSVLVCRSPADFRPVPGWVTERTLELREAFAPSEGLPPSLVAELAPLVAPRLERVVDHLRQRLGRERKLLPLPQLREMDPACVRRNSRRPGRTLVEKAGPRQQLLGVVRIPRFDTMENRVLVATARVLLSRAAQELRRPHPRDDVRARAYRRLARAAEAVLARPELDGVGSPRPDERPSNALIGDSDYRAVWRAGQLLRREDERFQEDWTSLSDVWMELVLLAAWSAAEGVGEAIPTWVRVTDGRERGLRIEAGGSRRWIEERGSEVVVTTLDADRAGQCIRVRRHRTSPEGVHLDEVRIDAKLLIGSVQLDTSAAGAMAGSRPSLELARSLVAAVLPSDSPAVRTSPASRVTPEFLGVSALDAHLLSYDGDSNRNDGPTAVANLAVPGEAPIEALGRPATWLPDVAGPEALCGPRAEEGGALLRAFRGRCATAVVIPDTLNEVGVRRLRARLGRAWFVWSPVAAALAAAAKCSDVFPAEPIHRYVLVVVATDAAVDVAVLEETEDEGPAEKRRPGRLWVRSAPQNERLAGRESGRFGAGEARGAWLRNPQDRAGWAIDADCARAVSVPSAPSVVDRVLSRATSWRGPAPSLLVTAGLDSAETRALTDHLALPAVHLGAAALAQGEHTFLVRFHAGLATWKDRLPSVSFEVVRERLQVPITLVRSGTLVAPGDAIDFTPAATFVLREGAGSVRFALQRDGRPADCAIVLDGPAFPLQRPTEVRVVLRYTYGLQGMEGAVEPVGPAPFARAPFRIDVAEQSAPTVDGVGDSAPPTASTDVETVPIRGAFGAPELRRRAPVAESLDTAVREAVGRLEGAFRQIQPKLLKEAQAQAGKVDPLLVGPLREVADAAKSLGGTGPEAGTFRTFLESKGVPPLDWLLELRVPGRGKPPLLGRDAKRTALRARAELAVGGGGEFGRWLVGDLAKRSGAVAPTDAFYALGRTVDGDVAIFAALCGLVPNELRTGGAWASAVRCALDATPTLATPTNALPLLQRTVDSLAALAARPDVESYRDAVRDFADLLPRLCNARPHALAPDEPEVVTAIDRLVEIRATLPDSVRSHGGRASANAEAEPLAVAISYLRGQYHHLPELR